MWTPYFFSNFQFIMTLLAYFESLSKNLSRTSEWSPFPLKVKLKNSEESAEQQIITKFYQVRKSIRDTCCVNYWVDQSNNFETMTMRHIMSHRRVKVEIKKSLKNKKINRA